MKDVKNKVFSGVFWRLGERFSAQLVTFIVSVILARLLDPDDYGTISLVLIITNLLQVFIDSGFGNALIQKKDADDSDFVTVFVFNNFACIIIYALLFGLSPFIADFYNIQSLTNIIRVSGTVLLISGVKNTIHAYVSKKMLFKKFFITTIFGTALSGIVAVIMAYRGFGVWAIVAQQLINPTVDTVLLWIVVKWRPKGKFDFVKLKNLFSFGWKLLIRDLLNQLFQSFRGLVIGKWYTTIDLAYYDNGKKLPNTLYSNVDSAIRSVIFPVFASEQNDIKTVKRHMLKMANICSYVTFPLMFGMAACGKQIISLLWTDKWLPAVPFLQITCFIWSLNSIQALNQQVMLALGRSDKCLKAEMIIKVVEFFSIIISVRFGVLAIALSNLVACVISLFINLWPNRYLIDCSIIEQFGACYKELLLGLSMAAIVWVMGRISINTAVLLPIQVTVGAMIYLVGSILLHLEGYILIRDILIKKVVMRK